MNSLQTHKTHWVDTLPTEAGYYWIKIGAAVEVVQLLQNHNRRSPKNPNGLFASVPSAGERKFWPLSHPVFGHCKFSQKLLSPEDTAPLVVKNVAPVVPKAKPKAPENFDFADLDINDILDDEPDDGGASEGGNKEADLPVLTPQRPAPPTLAGGGMPLKDVTKKQAGRSLENKEVEQMPVIIAKPAVAEIKILPTSKAAHEQPGLVAVPGLNNQITKVSLQEQLAERGAEGQGKVEKIEPRVVVQAEAVVKKAPVVESIPAKPGQGKKEQAAMEGEAEVVEIMGSGMAFSLQEALASRTKAMLLEDQEEAGRDAP